MALISLRHRRIIQETSPTIPDLMTQSALQLQMHRRRCFVGEMLRIGSSMHYPTQMLVIDKADVVSRVGFAFPPSDNGDGDDEKGETGVPAKYLKRGCTILILAAVRQDKPSWGEGFEVKDPGLVKILPFRLHDLIHLQERVTEFQSVLGKKRLCYGCEKRHSVTHRCPRCTMFYFCKRECQVAGIHQGNHNWDCTVLRDPDMLALFTGRGHELERFGSVSLQPQDGV
ncbi:zinc finger MYND domain-containing protein [Aspergillus undulatus]|uniref:zinc finger MYND domain-containing protein n=1 Tax=Aspergillus undulatus TaxID=1810928 RepID=UPI003CCC948E